MIRGPTTARRSRPMKILLHGQYAQQADRLAALAGAAHDVIPAKDLPPGGPIACDVLVSGRLAAGEAARVDARLLQVPGAGLDGIPLAALPADLPICNVFEHETPIAEYVTHAVLDHAIFPGGTAFGMDAAHWADTFRARPFHGEAQGRRVAIVGFGTIGRAIAQRLRALGLVIVAVNRKGSPDAAADEAWPVARLAEALATVDVAVLCVPLDEATRGLVGAAELAAMKPDALLINVARAPVVDEEALYLALRDRRIGRAVLDVWYRYPQPGEAACPPSRFPFHELPNVRATPHISGWTEGLIARRYAVIAENIQRLADGRPLRNVVR